MKILAVSDEECAALWDYYVPGRLKEYDLIISCGDLKVDYLSFLVTMAKCPVLYVHGNHDTGYDRNPPNGCDCIDDKLVVYNGLRILGLGGCRRYHPGAHQYTEAQMRKRIQKLRFHTPRPTVWGTATIRLTGALRPCGSCWTSISPSICSTVMSTCATVRSRSGNGSTAKPGSSMPASGIRWKFPPCPFRKRTATA